MKKKSGILSFLFFTFILFGNYILSYAKENKSISSAATTMFIGKEEYNLPCKLDKFLKNGWKISEKKFNMDPYRTEYWYEVRYTLSCKENGTKLIPWGTAIRTLEKNGSYLEVEVENRSEKIAKVEDSTVQQILVLNKHIKEEVELKNGLSLQKFEIEKLWKDGEPQKYLFSEGWMISQTDYLEELGFFEEIFYKIVEQKEQAITFYYDKEEKVFGIKIRNDVGGNQIK